MSKMIKCPKCGHMNSPDEEHCSNCGYKLGGTKQASAISFLQSMYKVAMACPRASGDVELNTKNRDKTIKKHNYGPLNLSDDGYWELIADKWNTTEAVARKSKCGNCVAFDVSPRMDECMPGPVSDGEGRLGYCWMHHFKCHSARTCNTWAKGGPIKKDEASHDWQKKAKGMEKEASFFSKKKQDRPKKQTVLVGGPSNLEDYAHFNLPDGNTIAVHNSIKKEFFESGNNLGEQLQAMRPHIGTKFHMYSSKANLNKEAANLKRQEMSSAIPASAEMRSKYKNRPKGAKYLKLEGKLYKFAGSEDSSVKSDILKAFKAEGGALGMKALKKHVKDPNVKSKLKELMSDGRVYKHRHGDFIEKQSSAVKPLVIGGGLFGAGVGAMADEENRLRGAAIGGSVGALGGYAGGKAIDHAVDTDPNIIRARQRLEKAKADGARAEAKGRESLRKAKEDLKKTKIKTKRVRKFIDKMKIRLAKVNADAKAGKISSMEASNRRLSIIREMADIQKTASATATKTDPAKWEAAKREAKAKMGGKHSARAMQLATQIYKKKGGGYSGAKPTSKNNSLKKWGKQKWGYSGKDKPGQGGSGVYLPKKRREALKSTKKGRSMLASATKKKHQATARGQQYSSHGLAAGTSLKKK